MKKYARCLSVALTLRLILNTTFYAWNARGHMMVAAIAYGKLTPAKKARVDALLSFNSDIDNWSTVLISADEA
jgi:hypothetical protein